jgi:hypothetical protein
VTVTGGIARESQRKWEMKTEDGLRCLKIMIAIVIPVLLVPAWLVLAGN